MGGCRSLGEAGQGLARKSSLTYLTARFDVDTQTGRKPDLSEVATDMRTTRNTGSSRTFQRRMAYKGTSSIILFQTVCNQQGKKGLTKAENVEICDEGDLLSVLLQEEIAFLIDERRDKEVKDIFNNKMGVIPGGVLPYMGYIGMCRCEGYGFQAVYSKIGYINQSVWL